MKEGAKYVFVLNYSDTPAEITVLEKMRDMYTGKEVSGSLTLEGYGTVCLRLSCDR